MSGLTCANLEMEAYALVGGGTSRAEGQPSVVLRVAVLGPVTAWNGQEELRVGPPRQQAVLGILATRANRVISRGELVDAVWGQDPPATAEGGIYTYVAGLRRVIEPTRSARGSGRILVSSGAGYVLHLVPGLPDAAAFEQHLARARQLRRGGDAAGAVGALDAALGLWRGAAFAGVPGPFAETERLRLAELRSGAAEERADVQLALGRHAEVLPDLTALVAEHPLRERMRGLLMLALYRSGRHAEALQVFADGQRVLAEELGIDPGLDLTRLHEQVLTRDPALETAGAVLLTDGTSLVTSHPDRAPAAGPPGIPVPAQLPLTAPGFAGRRDELAALHALLPPAGGAGRTVPVAVISGTAGVGKTALAVCFGHQAAPAASRTASCTSACGAWTRARRRWSRARCCGPCSPPSASRRTGSPPRSPNAPPCSAACWTASGS